MASKPSHQTPISALEFSAHPATITSISIKDALEVGGAGDTITCAVRLALSVSSEDLEQIPLEAGNRQALEAVAEGRGEATIQAITVNASWPAHTYELARLNREPISGPGQVIGRSVDVVATRDEPILVTWRITLSLPGPAVGELAALKGRTDVVLSTVRIPEPVQGSLDMDGDGAAE